MSQRRSLAEVLTQYQSDEAPPDLARLREEFGADLARRSRPDDTGHNQVVGPPVDVEQLIREGDGQAADEFMARFNQNRQ